MLLAFTLTIVAVRIICLSVLHAETCKAATCTVPFRAASGVQVGSQHCALLFPRSTTMLIVAFSVVSWPTLSSVTTVHTFCFLFLSFLTDLCILSSCSRYAYRTLSTNQITGTLPPSLGSLAVGSLYVFVRTFETYYDYYYYYYYTTTATSTKLLLLLLLLLYYYYYYYYYCYYYHYYHYYYN